MHIVMESESAKTALLSYIVDLPLTYEQKRHLTSLIGQLCGEGLATGV
jgi:hypothetical protein